MTEFIYVDSPLMKMYAFLIKIINVKSVFFIHKIHWMSWTSSVTETKIENVFSVYVVILAMKVSKSAELDKHGLIPELI